MTETHTLKNKAVDLDTLRGFKIDGKPASDDQILELLAEIECKGRLGVVQRRKIENVKISRKKYRRPVMAEVITDNVEELAPVEVIFEPVEQPETVEVVEPVEETIEPVEVVEPVEQTIETVEPAPAAVVTHDIRERLLDALALAKSYVTDYRLMIAKILAPKAALVVENKHKLAGRSALTHAEFVERMDSKGLLEHFELLSEYVDCKTPLVYRCKKCGVVKQATSTNLMKRTAGCNQYCKSKRAIVHRHK